MAKATPSLYQRLANRFTHLAANASDEDEEARRRAEEEDRARKAREEGDEEEDEEEEGISDEEREARHARNEGRRARAAERNPDEDDDEDEDEDEARKARAAERKRWGDVLSSPDAKGRVPLACSLLAETGMSAAKICAVLGSSPSEARHGLAARMASVQRPDIGSTTSAAPTALAADTPKGQAAALMRSYNKALGVDPSAA